MSLTPQFYSNIRNMLVEFSSEISEYVNEEVDDFLNGFDLDREEAEELHDYVVNYLKRNL